MHISERQPLEAKWVCYVTAQSVLHFRTRFPPYSPLSVFPCYTYTYTYIFVPLQTKGATLNPISRAPASRTFVTSVFSHMSTLGALSGRLSVSGSSGLPIIWVFFTSFVVMGGLLSILMVEIDTAFSRHGWVEFFFFLSSDICKPRELVVTTVFVSMVSWWKNMCCF